jgi:hypothetical protein
MDRHPGARNPFGREHHPAAIDVLLHRSFISFENAWDRRYPGVAINNRAVPVVVCGNVGKSAILTEFDFPCADTAERFATVKLPMVVWHKYIPGF